MDTATNPAIALPAYMRHCRDNGIHVWISYGCTEIAGWVLTVSKHTVEIQSADTGEIRTVALSAIDEATEVL